ncbi:MULTISPECIES: hypothetical protein [unclassified Flavobacterium]|uniref:hypothetical protein n=1 Tax=unclassified Flavobacterium TaxID=196869 RepID=UPI00131A6395|nr:MULTISPECIES: hypothetical protein [unclassified Flavobacterium]
MKELDLLKKDWQKEGNTFEQVSTNDIYVMIHKKSSSLVKWILIVSILEFLILNGISIFISSKEYDAFVIAHPIIKTLELINYVVIFGFIILFYKNYKSISTLNSAKDLIKKILKTRKVVTYYIFWNIIFGGLTGTYIGLQAFNEGYKDGSNTKVDILDPSSIIATLVFGLFFMGLIWCFYKLVYGTFLSRLSKNYSELKKIDL